MTIATIMLTHFMQLLTSAGLVPLHQLPQAAVTSVVGKRGLLLVVKQGRLWVTIDNDPKDFFVSAGEQLLLPMGCHAVLEAWSDQLSPTTYLLQCAPSRNKRGQVEERLEAVLPPDYWQARLEKDFYAMSLVKQFY